MKSGHGFNFLKCIMHINFIFIGIPLTKSGSSNATILVSRGLNVKV